MKKFLRIVLLIVLATAFSFCMYKVISKLLEYKASDDAYRRIEKEADVSDRPEDPETLDNGKMHIDWESLPDDTAGWLVIGDISYPVMYDKENGYYLHRLPDGTYNYGGSLFLQEANSRNFTDRNSIIYGHNMANGSMFGNLKKYASNDFTDFTFDLYLPDGTCHTYRYFACIHTNMYSDVYTYGFADDEAFLSWQEKMKGLSFVDCAAETDKDAKFVTLSTCNGPAGTSQRLDIIGQEEQIIQVQNPASWYEKAKEESIRKSEEEPAKENAAAEEQETTEKE